MERNYEELNKKFLKGSLELTKEEIELVEAYCNDKGYNGDEIDTGEKIKFYLFELMIDKVENYDGMIELVEEVNTLSGLILDIDNGKKNF